MRAFPALPRHSAGMAHIQSSPVQQSTLPRGSLLVSRAGALGYTSEYELYRAECDFHTRALNIMRELTKNLKQEWHTYQAEWRANQLAKNLQAATAVAMGAEAAAAIDEAMCPGGSLLPAPPATGCGGRARQQRGTAGRGGVAGLRASTGVCAQAFRLSCPTLPSPPPPPHHRHLCCTLAIPAGGYHPVQVGEQFNSGRYTVLHYLGQGHYSTVWMVHDTLTQQQVAMKVGGQGQVAQLTGLLPGCQ